MHIEEKRKRTDTTMNDISGTLDKTNHIISLGDFHLQVVAWNFRPSVRLESLVYDLHLGLFRR